MNVFLSYASPERSLAEHVSAILRANGHSVFFDRAEISAGDPFDPLIRQAILRSDILVFLASPSALRQGAYTLSEIRIAEERWPSAAHRVIPVLLGEVQVQDLPPYLRAVSSIKPVGDPIAEIAASVAAQERHVRWWRVSIEPIAAGLVVGVVLGVIAGIFLNALNFDDMFRWSGNRYDILARSAASSLISVIAAGVAAYTAETRKTQHAVATILLLIPLTFYYLERFLPVTYMNVTMSSVVGLATAGVVLSVSLIWQKLKVNSVS